MTGVELTLGWEVEGRPLPAPRRFVSLAHVAGCECGWRTVLPHISYSRRQAEQMATAALDTHRCLRADQ